MGNCFFPGRARPSRLIPLKCYLDMVVSSRWVRCLPAPPAPFPLHHLPTSPCQNFTSPSSSPSSSPRPPGGEQKRNLRAEAGGQTPGGVWGPQPPGPPPHVGSASCRGVGAERVAVLGRKCRGVEGQGRVRSWRNVFLPCGHLQRGDGTIPGPSLPVGVVLCAAGVPRAHPRWANGGRRLSAS